MSRDPHSHARPDEVAVRNLSLDLTVDFETRTITGSASLDLDRREPDVGTLVLDTRGLVIDRVTDGEGVELAHELGEHDPVLGRSLSVQIGRTDSVVVHYSTGEGADALQWLEPAQTSGDKPFLFSQAQPILARTWIPCQDSPSVRMTYAATIRVPEDLLAVMSAANPQDRSDDGVYRFEMPQPVPSYLIALAVGDLEFRSLGARSGVYAEPSVVESAAWEFGEVEQMIIAAEGLYGPYRWGRYDMLVLPPSFPFGGMENPRLTFVTPTILAGDRSLVTLIAHELAHSWSGNLVTNAKWDDVWLNEGFTVYFETRIDEAIYGETYTRMIQRLGRQELDEEVERLDPRMTWLELDFTGKDPGGPMTVPYEKGSLLLRLIEQTVGREQFDVFLRDYFDRHAFTSVTTEIFLSELRRDLLDPMGISPEDLRLEEWVHGPGVPDNAPYFESAAFDVVDAQVAAFLAGAEARSLDTAGWVSQQWVHFVRALPSDLPSARLDEVDAVHGFSRSRNIEVATSWLELSIESGFALDDADQDDAVADFLTRHGRAAYVRRVYAKLAATPTGLARARQIYASARPTYHSVTRNAVDRVLA
ncbi:M1 family metallopeptidase [Nocardioides agariphilus]|jgi:aminopeptidase N|uniref:Aminopeptidase N n=1 Tax=Nocardioides agariphilus TaxID=433664 RepID=A0A930VS19_9ACTN|nr:M1 family metallopeptidase [Nocardioides agariphilus]MBF4768880.1 M1 family metallopeptidase [Nocardioides agariphilus]